MSTTGRRKNSSVIEGLRQNPFRYAFVPAVRLLEQAAAGADDGARAKNPVARYTPPATEVVRFHSTQSFSFPAAELGAVDDRQGPATAQWHMHVNFMGATGSGGVMPFHYTELVLKRLKLKDRSLTEFLDLFNHRLISLFYQASIKYRLPIACERAAHQGTDTYTKSLLALIGLGTSGLNRRLATPDQALLYYAGLLTKRVRSVDGLKQILSHLFSLPVEIREFIGQRQELIDDVRTRLPGPMVPRGQNNQLGKTVMLGRKGWFSQGKIRIVLGTLTKEQIAALAPGMPTLKALDQVVRLFINDEYDHDYVMRLRHRDVPRPMRLSAAQPPKLAWDSWLATAVAPPAPDDATVEVPVSARRLC